MSKPPYQSTTRRVAPRALQDDDGRTWVPAGRWGFSDVSVLILGVIIGAAAAWGYATQVLGR